MEDQIILALLKQYAGSLAVLAAIFVASIRWAKRDAARQAQIDNSFQSIHEKIDMKFNAITKDVDEIKVERLRLVEENDLRHRDHYNSTGKLREDVGKIKGKLGLNGGGA